MSRLNRNIAYNLAGQAALVLLGLVAVRVVFHRLGGDAFGIILFAQAASLTLAGVLDLGISATTVREVAAYASADGHYIVRLLRTAGLLYWVAYLVLALACLLLAPLVATGWINLGQLDPRQAGQLLQVLGVGALLALPRSLYGSVLRGLQQMGLINAIEVGTIASQQLGWLLILQNGNSLMAVAAWFSIAYGLGTLVYLLAVVRAIGARVLLPGYFGDAIRRNRAFAGHAMFNAVLGTVHGQSDKLLVSKLLPIVFLGTYGFAWTVVAAVSRVSTALAQAAYPVFAALAQRDDQDGLLREYRRVQKMVLVLGGPFFAALVFASGPLFSLTFGSSMAGQLSLPTLLLCLAFYMNGTVVTPYMLSLATGRPDIAARQNLLAVFIVLPVAFVAVWRLGLVGAAFSWFFYQCLAYVYGIPRICKACLHMPTSSWFGQLVTPVLALITVYVPAYVIAAGPGSSRLVWLAVAFLVSTAIYILYARGALMPSASSERPDALARQAA